MAESEVIFSIASNTLCLYAKILLSFVAILTEVGEMVSVSHQKFRSLTVLKPKLKVAQLFYHQADQLKKSYEAGSLAILKLINKIYCKLDDLESRPHCKSNTKLGIYHESHIKSWH